MGRGLGNHSFLGLEVQGSKLRFPGLQDQVVDIATRSRSRAMHTSDLGFSACGQLSCFYESESLDSRTVSSYLCLLSSGSEKFYRHQGLGHP